MTASTAKSVNGEHSTTLLPERDVEQVGVVLVDEAVDALVRDEEQDVVERAAGRVDVAPGRSSRTRARTSRRNAVQVRRRSSSRGGLEEAEVVVDRELDVHVQHQPAAAGT